MNKKYLDQLFNNSKSEKIFVIGDIMLDRYLFGDVNRISPEAPVQVFDIRRSEYRLGGAANVGLNIKSLGSEPVLIGVIGNDNEGKLLINELENLNLRTDGLIIEDDRPTTCKTRVISDSHHLLRIDSESKDEISEVSEKKIISYLEKTSDESGIIILQDYNKGVLSKSIIKKIIKFAEERGIKILVDPKFDNFFEFGNVYLFKPNRKELEDAFGRKMKNSEDFEQTAKELLNKLKCENLILTLGEKGMMILENSNGELKIGKIETKARKVADVSGAGDTVISTIAVCLAGGAGIKDAAEISNHAAGLVVEEVGIVPVNKESLIENILKDNI
ncbi:MAG: D-beta-D-heptose 7-phosphate kinase [Ignavibacteria bacterium]|nr:D-beta-D-heptose 7-phosphate kinase [Ignavibacteria bacterium]